MGETTHTVRLKISVEAGSFGDAVQEALKEVQDILENPSNATLEITDEETGHTMTLVVGDLAICDNCGYIYHYDPTESLSDIPNILSRLDPGGEVPLSQCHGCGGLAYKISCDR